MLVFHARSPTLVEARPSVDDQYALDESFSSAHQRRSEGGRYRRAV